MTLGEKLTLVIKEKKLSVRAVAMATELPYRSISQLLESDSHRSLDIDILIPVADFLGVTLNQLLDERVVYPFAEEAPSVPVSAYRYIELYNLPVSAGTGVYVEDNGTEMIKVAVSPKTEGASFALRVQGDSMSPVYHDRDIILIRSQPYVEVGQPGIFILNREAYFKILGDRCLYSLNPVYAPIPLRKNDSFSCKGLVLCRIRKKENR